MRLLTKFKFFVGTRAAQPVRKDVDCTESNGIIALAVAMTLLLLLLGIGVSNLGFVLVWFAQCCLGIQVLRLFMPHNPHLRGAFAAAGPGYFVGFLLTTWVFFLARGGTPARLLLYLVFIAAIVAVLRRERLTARELNQSLVPAIALFSLVLVGLTREFPQLITSALGAFTLAIALVTNRFSWKLRGPLATIGTIVLVVGMRIRSAYWFLESDDLALRMGSGIVSVIRGSIETTGAYPLTRYHWVSPVGTALQADLGQSALLQVFTIASPVAWLVTLIASFGLILRSTCSEKVGGMAFLFSGAALVVLAKVLVDTEAVVGRLGILVALIGLVRVVQLGLLRDDATRTDSVRVAALFVVIGAMLLLYRPDLVVFMLLLLAGLFFSLVISGEALRLPLLTVSSLIVITFGLLLMRVILPLVSQSGLSYATLEVIWPPPTVAGCQRGSLLRDILCIASIKVDLWATLFWVIVVLLVSHSLREELRQLIQLCLPGGLSYLPFYLTLTSDFPSAVEGFLEIGTRSVIVISLVTVVAILQPRNSQARAGIVGLAILLAVLHLSLRDFLQQLFGRRQAGISGRLQGIFTPSLLFWLMASFILFVIWMGVMSTRARKTSRHLPAVIVIALVFIGVWSEVRERRLPTDVPKELVAISVGPKDVFEVGAWLAVNTPKNALIATNYQCNPGEFSRCSTLRSDRGATWPRATANWMLLAASRRDFLYLSQPWYNEPKFAVLHALSVRPGSQAIPDFRELERMNVSIYVAFRQSTKLAAWANIERRAAFTTENFAVIQLNPYSPQGDL
jgi:hypothetical protein